MRHGERPGWLVPACAFAVNGGLYGSLLPRLPEIADRLSASATQFGLVLFAAALGGLLGSLGAPALVRWRDESGATLLAGCAYAVCTVAVAWAPGLWILGVAFLLSGLVDGAHDVAMNAQAVRTQQRMGRPLMGRMHATWSLSLAAAGVLGAAAAGLRVPVVVHIGLVATVAIAAQLLVTMRFRRMRGVVSAVPASEETTPVAQGRAGVKLRHVIPVLGIAAFAASYVESPGQEWTGIVLSRGFAAEPRLAAAAPVLFACGLVSSRLVLDAIVRRVGARTAATVSGVLITLAMLAGSMVALGGGSAGWALAAVGIAGLGAGPVFPLLFGTADHLSARRGITAARTASIISALSRVGAISAPIAMGALTQTFGMAMVFVVMAGGGCLVLFALPRAVRQAEEPEHARVQAMG